MAKNYHGVNDIPPVTHSQVARSPYQENQSQPLQYFNPNQPIFSTISRESFRTNRYGFPEADLQNQQFMGSSQFSIASNHPATSHASNPIRNMSPRYLEDICQHEGMFAYQEDQAHFHRQNILPATNSERLGCFDTYNSLEVNWNHGNPGTFGTSNRSPFDKRNQTLLLQRTNGSFHENQSLSHNKNIFSYTSPAGSHDHCRSFETAWGFNDNTSKAASTRSFEEAFGVQRSSIEVSTQHSYGHVFQQPASRGIDRFQRTKRFDYNEPIFPDIQGTVGIDLPFRTPSAKAPLYPDAAKNYAEHCVFDLDRGYPPIPLNISTHLSPYQHSAQEASLQSVSTDLWNQEPIGWKASDSISNHFDSFDADKENEKIVSCGIPQFQNKKFEGNALDPEEEIHEDLDNYQYKEIRNPYSREKRLTKPYEKGKNNSKFTLSTQNTNSMPAESYNQIECRQIAAQSKKNDSFTYMTRQRDESNFLSQVREEEENSMLQLKIRTTHNSRPTTAPPKLHSDLPLIHPCGRQADSDFINNQLLTLSTKACIKGQESLKSKVDGADIGLTMGEKYVNKSIRFFNEGIEVTFENEPLSEQESEQESDQSSISSLSRPTKITRLLTKKEHKSSRKERTTSNQANTSELKLSDEESDDELGLRWRTNLWGK